MIKLEGDSIMHHSGALERKKWSTSGYVIIVYSDIMEHGKSCYFWT